LGVRSLLPWSVGINVISAALIILFARYFAWLRCMVLTLSLQGILSLFPLALITCLTTASAESRPYLFGLTYTLFIFCTCFLLVGYALANAEDVASSRSGRIWVFVTSSLVYLSIAPWVAQAAWPIGDEPHYLLLTHSLLVDHDFDLSNNYLNKDYRSFLPSDLREHHAFLNSRGEEHSSHGVGLSMLLVPGYALGKRVGAMCELGLVAALLALAIFELAAKIGGSRRGALLVWALFAFTSPVIIYSSHILTEIPAAASLLAASIAFWNFLKRGRRFFLGAAGMLLGTLLLLNIRYWMVVGPLFAVITLYILLHREVQRRLQSLAVLIFPVLIAVALLIGYNIRFYESVLPNKGFSVFFARADVGLLGLFFDRAYGLLPFAPVYLIALCGARVALKRQLWLTMSLLVPSVCYILFMGFVSFWSGGWGPPGRYLLIGMVPWAPLAALVLSSCRPSVIIVALATWSYLIAIAQTSFPLTRWPSVSDTSQGGLAEFCAKHIGLDFGSLFPSFIQAGVADYLLAGFWLSLASVCIWTLRRRRRANLVSTLPRACR
jgi:hypothetical protein